MSTPPRGPSKQFLQPQNVRNARMGQRPVDPNLMETAVLGVFDPYGTGYSAIRSGPSEPWTTYKNGRYVAPKTPNRPTRRNTMIPPPAPTKRFPTAPRIKVASRKNKTRVTRTRQMRTRRRS